MLASSIVLFISPSLLLSTPSACRCRGDPRHNHSSCLALSVTRHQSHDESANELQMPMKIIKVGSAAQSRVAQACDRCRSKKIRCDGITPCCSQCANVGFECKTSDKLSRRAFPRGYTESLEERVRQLECEVRDLKGLLDEKDEKIDLLSKFHDFSTRRPSIPGPTLKQEVHSPSSDSDESEVFSVKNPNNLLRISTRCEPHWAGASSSSAYLGKDDLSLI